MKCPRCDKDIPDDALFCPYCGHEVAGVPFVPLEDLGELEALASTLKERYLPKEWSCKVDRKNKRLCFALSFKASVLLGLLSRSKPVMVSSLITALDRSLRHAEEDLGLRLALDRASAFLGYPTLYYKVLVRKAP